MGRQNPEGMFTHEYFEAVGEAVGEVYRAMAGYRSLAVDVRGLSVRGPGGPGDEFLLTVRGSTEDGTPVVAFHSATTLMELFTGLAARLGNGTLNWKADQYARQ